MRFVLSALLVVLALPATAQSQFSEEEGAFLTFEEFTLQRAGSDGWNGGGEVGVGWRFGNGADVALTGSYSALGLGSDQREGSSWSLGLASGYTLRPAPRTVARVQGLVAYRSQGATFQETQQQPFVDYDGAAVGLDLSATVGYDVPVAGSFSVRPTVGVFGQANQLLSIESSGVQGSLREAGDWRTNLGLQVEAPVTFRLFGTDAAIVPAYRSSRVGNWPVSGGTLGFRINF
ncbi:MAG: hypothetical protein CMM84_06690 [Rhodothermaceae bacterium]|nr:hypothetical protein [Rhodothermaceae bacterium]MBC15170.1 hypothetical protein [Rhodothermaceae bacterium]